MSNDVLCFKGKYNITINIFAFCIPSEWLSSFNSISLVSRERRQKKRYTLRVEFHLAKILRNPKIGWEKKKSTNNLFMDTKHLNCMLIKRNGYFGSSVNRSIWLLGVFYQWFIITVQTKSCFGSWNVSNIRIVCLALFFLPSL